MVRQQTKHTAKLSGVSSYSFPSNKQILGGFYKEFGVHGSDNVCRSLHGSANDKQLSAPAPTQGPTHVSLTSTGREEPTNKPKKKKESMYVQRVVVFPIVGFLYCLFSELIYDPLKINKI